MGIEDGTLRGVNHACPAVEGTLKGVGLKEEYHCGEQSEPGPFEFCSSASGAAGGFDCAGVSESAVICGRECDDWYYQCANSVAYLKPVPPGTKCKGNDFVHAAVCAGS